MSLDQVPGTSGVYIGGLISLRRNGALKKANITHVVTALFPPLDNDLYARFKHLVIGLNDVEDEDILQHFPQSNAFIQEGLDSGGGVLVHCAMGKSRSATLCIAYMLSTDRSLNVQDALNRLRKSRPIVEPNPGFMEQLELYHAMGCPVEIDLEPAYQRWLYKQRVEMSVACGQAPDEIRFEDEVSSPESAGVGGNSSAHASAMQARCRRCRRVLATSQYILAHEPSSISAAQPAQALQTGPITSLDQRTEGDSASDPRAKAKIAACAHIFIDPISWMRNEFQLGKLEGRLNCPGERCGVNIGKYAWQGMRCTCGRWVTPAISLLRSKVDVVGMPSATKRLVGSSHQSGKI